MMYSRPIIVMSIAGVAAILIATPQTAPLGTLISFALSVTLIFHIEAILLGALRRLRRFRVALSAVGIAIAVLGNLIAYYSYVTHTYWLSLAASFATLLGFATAALGLPSLIWQQFQEGAVTQ